jgi:hypothetical protein
LTRTILDDIDRVQDILIMGFLHGFIEGTPEWCRQRALDQVADLFQAVWDRNEAVAWYRLKYCR